MTNREKMSFKSYLTACSFSASTINRYLSFEKGFLLYFSVENKSMKELDANDLLRYFNSKQSGQVKRATLVHVLNRIDHYYRYLELENPLKDFQLKGIEKPSPLVLLTVGQLKQLAVCYQHNKRLSVGSKVGVSLLVYQGLSTQELPLLRVEQVDLERGEITLPERVLKARTLPLEAAQILNLAGLIKDKKPRDMLLDYHGSSHGQNRHVHWKAQIRRELNKQGIRLPFTNLQQLRASRIAQWIKELGMLRAQYLAGHGCLSSTQKYQQQDQEQLRASLEQLHPLF